ncbi:MAG: hypothetical protein WCD18_12635, partial [Thermosynechococcaceae cyanobacterium]
MLIGLLILVNCVSLILPLARNLIAATLATAQKPLVAALSLEENQVANETCSGAVALVRRTSDNGG